MKTPRLPASAQWCLVALCLWTLPSSPAHAALRLVSSPLSACASAGGNSVQPVLSANGRYLVFLSHANNLVTNDDQQPWLDVFRRDLWTSQITLVSVATNGAGGANEDCSWPAVSSDGRYVAFASRASNLVTNDTNPYTDVFVRDLVSGTTVAVSVNSSNSSTAYGGGNQPCLSADGRRAAFLAGSADLVATNLTNYWYPWDQVYVRDLDSQSTTLISLDPTVPRAGDGPAFNPAMSPDGRWIAYVSAATNLVPGVQCSSGHLFLYDALTATTAWASAVMTNYYQTNGCSPRDDYGYTFSANSEFLVFSSLLSGDVFRLRLADGSLVLVGNMGSGALGQRIDLNIAPSVSADGRYVAYADDTNIFVVDVDSGAKVCASLSTNGTPLQDGTSTSPILSANGRRVAFLSTATSLVTNPVAGGDLDQLYVRDLDAQTTKLVNVDMSGAAQGTGQMLAPTLNGDGNLLAFESDAPNLVPQDANNAMDVFVRQLTNDTTVLISRSADGLPTMSGAERTWVAPSGSGLTDTSRASAQTGDPSAVNAVSADGRFVVFTAFDRFFVPDATNGFTHVFVRDLYSGTCQPVSVASDGATLGNASAYAPVLSADGRFVAFTSQASNLVPLEANGKTHVFLRDLQAGLTRLVSRQGADGPPGDGDSTRPALSKDGRLVVFQSLASNLVNFSGAWKAGNWNVFLQDTRAQTNRLVSQSWDQAATGNGRSEIPIISPDSQWVAFVSTATNLSRSVPPSYTYYHVFAHNLASNRTDCVSSIFIPSSYAFSTAGYTGNFSADSRRLTFVTNPYLGVRDLAAGTNLWWRVGSSSGFYYSPSLDGAGNGLVFVWREPNLTRAVIHMNLTTGVSNLVSKSLAASTNGNGDSSNPIITLDGRYVVYTSRASDLVPGDTNQVTDVFVYDVATSNNLLCSLSPVSNRSGNSVSWNPLLGADGRSVLFQSFASDLAPGDYNNNPDLFLLQLEAADSDNDGMSDDWELAYFGTLDRDGTRDFDADGATDYQEFIAGTDPTNQGSVLRVMTLTPLSGVGTTLLWPGIRGKTYQVQYRDDVTAPDWTDLAVPVSLNGATASAVDSTAEGKGHRFYRVVIRQ
jgi:Tol biopolymer transport system component